MVRLPALPKWKKTVQSNKDPFPAPIKPRTIRQRLEDALKKPVGQANTRLSNSPEALTLRAQEALAAARAELPAQPAALPALPAQPAALPGQ
jgi:hypothetical protein